MRTFSILQFFLIFMISLSISAYEFGTDSYKITSDNAKIFPDENKVQLEGHVKIIFKDATITCDRFTYSTVSKDFTGSGNVRIIDQLSDFRSNAVNGNLETKLYQTGRHHLTNGPWFIIGNKARSFPDKSINLDKVRVTTCDIHHAPHWHFSGSNVHVLENGKIAMWNPILRFGDIPVFWLPYMQSRIESNDGIFKIVPGHDSDWGTFVLISTKYDLTENLTATVMLDYRSKKGLGGGVQLNHKTASSSTDLLLYGTQDGDPPENGDGFNQRFNSEDSRHRVYLNHRSSYFDDRLTLRGKFNKLSDIEFIEDFYDEELDNDGRYEQFNTYFDAEWVEENYTLAIYARPKVNSFYSAVERLPEISFDLPRYEIADGLFYTNHNSLSKLETKWREFDEPLPTRIGDPITGTVINPSLIENTDYESTRFDSLHMFHYQTKYNNWLNLIPRAGLRLTYYSDSSEGEVDSAALASLITANDPNEAPESRVTNYDDDGSSLFRLIGEIGFEANFKAYNTENGYKNEFWEINGLRHIIQPYLNWNWIPFSTEDRDNIYFFDEIDRISEQNFVRVGTEQRWQTRREGRIHTFLTVDNYVDFHIQSENGATGLGDFGTEVQWNPTKNFSVRSELLIDLDELDINEFRTSTSYKVNDKLKTSLSYHYRGDYTSRDLFSNGSTLYNTVASSSFTNTYRESHGISLSASYLINQKTLILGRASYSFTQGGLTRYLLELQRKLHCWTMALRVEQDNDDTMRYMIQFYLNAFPDASFGS
jgi:LPS-assembly protein